MLLRVEKGLETWSLGGRADRLGRAQSDDDATPYSIDNAQELLNRAISKALAGCGFAQQILPDI